MGQIIALTPQELIKVGFKIEEILIMLFDKNKGINNDCLTSFVCSTGMRKCIQSRLDSIPLSPQLS